MSFAKALENIEAKAKENTIVKENDYIGADGLLFCGNCHTPKQVRIDFLGAGKTPYCLCKCELEKREAEKEAIKRLETERQIQRNKAAAFPDAAGDSPEDDMRGWTFERDNAKHPELSNAARKYVENFDLFKSQGKGLLLYGSVGVGKSYIAACIANALLDKGYSVLMTTFDRIERTAFGMRDGKQEYFDSLNRYSLLILDDLGVERSTEYMQELVYGVIDSRSRAGLPLIITSNLTANDLKNPQGVMNQRIYSRILKMCHPIYVKGEDQRRQKAIESFAETKKILGV